MGLHELAPGYSRGQLQTLGSPAPNVKFDRYNESQAGVLRAPDRSRVAQMWKFEHSVEYPVPRDFAWRFWTNVENWAAVDPGVEFAQLHGPFAAGTQGVTKPRGGDVVEWRLAEVEDCTRALVEISVPGAVIKFLWTFQDLPGNGTQITQRVWIEGERADDYVGQIAPELEKGMPQGMQRLGEAIARAAAR